MEWWDLNLPELFCEAQLIGESLSLFSFILKWIFSNAERYYRNDAMKNIHTYQCKLVQSMAFISTDEILKSIKSQGQILWKLRSLQRVRAPSLPAEPVVSFPASWGFGCLCMCWHGVAVPSLITGWSWPWLPGLITDPPHHYVFVWWSQSCWPALVTITGPALCDLLGCCGTAWLLGEDAAQPAWLSPLSTVSPSPAEEPALTTPWSTS